MATATREKQILDRSSEFQEPTDIKNLLAGLGIGAAAMAVPFLVGYFAASQLGFVAKSQPIANLSAFYEIIICIVSAAVFFMHKKEISLTKLLSWTAGIALLIGAIFPSATLP